MEEQLKQEAITKIEMLKKQLVELECENKHLRDRLVELVTVESLDANRKMQAAFERRELALGRNKPEYERQNGIMPTSARRLSFSEVMGCSGAYDEISLVVLETKVLVSSALEFVLSRSWSWSWSRTLRSWSWSRTPRSWSWSRTPRSCQDQDQAC